MKKLNYFKLTAFFLIFVLFGCFIFTPPLETNEQLRNINVNAIGCLSFEEKTDKLLNQFDDYDANVSENIVGFTGQSTIDTSMLSSFDFVTTYDNDVTKLQKTIFDSEKMEFELINEYYQNEELILQECFVIYPYYDEIADDYLFEYEGKTCSVKETLDTDNLENCVVLVDDALILAALLVITIIVAYPVISQSVTVLVEKVYEVISSFFRWLTRIITKTVTTYIVNTSVKYKVKIGSKSYTLTKIKDKTRTFTRGLFYPAVADTDDGYVYISSVPISQSEAVGILASSKKVKAASSNKYFTLSTYTYYSYDARNAAIAAAKVLGKDGYTQHGYHNDKGLKKGVFFIHYHPGIPIASHAHSFYGSPWIKL